MANPAFGKSIVNEEITVLFEKLTAEVSRPETHPRYQVERGTTSGGDLVRLSGQAKGLLTTVVMFVDAYQELTAYEFLLEKHLQ